MKKLTAILLFSLIALIGFSQPYIIGDESGNVTIGNELTVSDTLQLNGVLKGIEIATPTIADGYWSIYGKSDNLLYFLDGAGNEQSVGGIQSDFASMTISSGGATVIDGSSTWHAYIDAGVGNLSTNWTFVEGVRTDLTGATFATSGGGSETQITVITHNLSINDYVTLSGNSTGGYNTTTSTVHQVIAVGSSTDFTLDVAFVDDPATEGFVIRGDQLIAGTNATGTYIVQCSASGFISTNAANCQFGVFKNGVLEAKRDRRFSNATDRGAWNFANGRIITIVATDVVWIGILNEDNSNNVTIGDQDFSFHKL